MMVDKAEKLNFDLYPVTCQALSKGRSDLEVLDALIAGGVKIVQLREKDLPDRDFFFLAQEFRRRTSAAGVTLIINDRVDICLVVKADGVHLGQDDLPLPKARKLLGPDYIIGASTHFYEEALQAVEEGADYINVGPVFATQTKAHVSQPVGLELFKEIQASVAVPVTVMGGIKLDNLDQVLRTGARRIAVVTALTQADDISAEVRRFRHRILSFSPNPATV
jgi:thiamine-phosphate pyrophosphorylase